MHTRLFAAATTLLLLAGVAVATPGQAAAAKSTRTSVAAAKPVAGKKVTLAATVTPKANVGTVRFAVAGKSLTGCTKATVKAGRAVCSTTFGTPGTRTVTATYSGRTATWTASTGTRKVTVSVAPSAKAVGTIVGGTGACTTSTGALVAVGFGTWNGPIVRGCDTTPTKGSELLTTAGFTLAGTQHDGPTFVCRIGHPLFDGGTRYPTAATEACKNTPPADAYWSYWLADKGSNTWRYASLGAYSQNAVDGQVQAWTYGGTDVQGTSGQPTFTPNQVRAGLATAAKPARRTALAAPRTANLTKAVAYLTDRKNLIGGTRYEPFGGGFADYGLTMDGALALAATGTDDTALRAIVNGFDKRTKDGSGRTVDDYTGIGTSDASGGSIAKEALVAEVAGYDPRSFGGHDLIAALGALVCSAADAATRCAAEGNYQDAQSVFSQSLGVLAQLRGGDTAGAARPIAYLESLQLPSGAFPSIIPAQGSAAEVDSTAMGAMALALAGDDTAVTKALTWLAGQQKSDGGFPGAAGNSTNSAALAIMGLTLGGTKYGDEIDAARTFLAGRQNSDGGFDVASDGQQGSDLRASTQVVSGLVGTPLGTLVDDVATPAATQPDARDGADFLISKLVDGNRLESSFGDQTFVDYGGTADVAIALAAAGGRDKTLVGVVRYLRTHVADYVDPDAKTGGPYGGASGKLATLAEITGQRPTSFGGTDLLALLRDNVCTARGDGDFPACSAAGDFVGAYSGIGQAFGVLALARGGSTVPAAALDRLLALQCADGGFSSELIAAGGDCTSDVDTTGLAIQALVLLPTTTARDSVRQAVAYLRRSQGDNGSWQGGTVKAESTNSTALAVQGLLAAPASADFPTGGVRALATRSDPDVKAAIAYLGGRQNTDGGFGISTAAPDSDVRATSQIVPAVAFTTLTTLSHPISLAAAPSSGSSSSAVTTPTDGTSSSTPAGGSTDPTGAASGGGTADTGVRSLQLLGYALVLLLGGGLLLGLGRRRQTVALVATVVGRHRGSHR